MSGSSNNHIIMIHGRGAKPGSDALLELWSRALQLGLERDAPDKLEAYEASQKHMVYFADQLSEFAEEGFNESLDLDNRRQNLAELAARRKSKGFRRKHYEALPGKTPVKEFAMDLSASVGLGGLATRRILPELTHYWQDRDGWATRLRAELSEQISTALAGGGRVLILSHCIGSVLAWDSLWQVSHERQVSDHRVTRWITFGSPLAANSVRNKLLGHDEKGVRRYPTVLNVWHNVAAEDDYVSHDKTVANDFNDMLKRRLIGDIRDHTIYNLSVRYGRSNPHSSAGYLIHPCTSELLAQWLAETSPDSAG